MTKIIAINGSDAYWTRHRYVLAFGAYGWTRLLVWANSLDEALDECIDWLAEHAPGLLCDENVNEDYREALAEGCGESEAWERATADTVCGGNAGNHILSHEWFILAEDPDRQTIKSIESQQ